MRRLYHLSIVLLALVHPVRPDPSPSPPIPSSAATTHPLREPDTLRLFTLNAYLRPLPVSLNDHNHCRARGLASYLTGNTRPFDVVALSETFDRRATRRISRALADAFPHQLLHKPVRVGAEVNGGLSLLSRFPILRWTAQRFHECSGLLDDCLAAKGFLHAVLRVSESRSINIVNTHLDSGTSRSASDARRAQLQQLRAYLQDNPDVARWPTLLVGDLNINGLRWDLRSPDIAEYRQMMATLRIAHTPCLDPQCVDSPIDVIRATRGPWQHNAQQTRALTTYNCAGFSPACLDVTRDAHWRERQRLDYILDLGPPRLAPQRILELQEASQAHLRDPLCPGGVLSDHAAIEATFGFDVARADQSNPPRSGRARAQAASLDPRP